MGAWGIDPDDLSALEAYGQSTMRFAADGSLQWSTEIGDLRHTALLTWRTEGADLLTDQPTSPAPERTRYELTCDALVLNFQGVASRWLRIPS